MTIITDLSFHLLNFHLILLNLSLFPVLVSETATEAVPCFSQGYPLPPPLLSVTVVNVLGSAAEASSIVLIVSVFPYEMSELSVVLVKASW